PSSASTGPKDAAPRMASFERPRFPRTCVVRSQAACAMTWSDDRTSHRLARSLRRGVCFAYPVFRDMYSFLQETPSSVAVHKSRVTRVQKGVGSRRSFQGASVDQTNGT